MNAALRGDTLGQRKTDAFIAMLLVDLSMAVPGAVVALSTVERD